MSADGENSNLYTTRASGELRDRLDEYVENHGDSKSAALRELLDLGEQTAGAEAEPAVLQDRLDDVRKERDELEKERDALKEDLRAFKLVSDIIAGGFLAFLMITGVFTVGIATAVIPAVVEEAARLIASMAVMAGCGAWLWLHIRPALGDAVSFLRARVSETV